jgi:hypothetical protein
MGSDYMKIRLLALAAVTLLLPGWTQAEIERARQAAHSYGTDFEKCLIAEIRRQVSTSISSQDFALLIKGSCLVEKNKFMVPLVDYIVMTNNAPTTDQSAVFAAANSTISQYYDAAVKTFVETRNSR